MSQSVPSLSSKSRSRFLLSVIAVILILLGSAITPCNAKKSTKKAAKKTVEIVSVENYNLNPLSLSKLEFSADIEIENFTNVNISVLPTVLEFSEEKTGNIILSCTLSDTIILKKKSIATHHIKVICKVNDILYVGSSILKNISNLCAFRVKGLVCILANKKTKKKFNIDTRVCDIIK